MAEPMTYREFLTYAAIMRGTPWMLAKEAVATTVMEHPEWPTDLRTWAEWEEHDHGRR